MAYTTIKKPSDYFNTVLYTGDGTNGQNITGVGFQPDLCWIKDRTAAQEHMWYDAVRGADKLLRSNNTAGDATTSTTTYFNSFDSDGFTVGSESALGGSGANLVGWNWLGANGTASNTDGSISSTVSASTTSGFSIVSYTGNGTDNATIGHGLGIKPDCLIVKNRDDGTDGWGYWNKGMGAETQQMALNLGNAVFTDDIFKSSSSTTVTLGTDNWSNANTEKYIMYAFAEKTGFSKFGSYTGNGSTDGTFVYLGFKPAFVIIKKTNTAEAWLMLDTKRGSYNFVDEFLQPQSSAAETNMNIAGGIDVLSNGIKMRHGDGTINGSGGSYMYMAFAEQPLVGDNPATAR